MCFTFEKNNKRPKKSVNCFLQDGAIAVGIEGGGDQKESTFQICNKG